jgi:hypothetical protein
MKAALSYKGNSYINFVPGHHKFLVVVLLDNFKLGELFNVLVNVGVGAV